MRIDVIWPILRVIFNNRDTRVFPLRTIRNSLDEKSERVIVISNIKLRRRTARADAIRMVIRQANDRQIRQTIASPGSTLRGKRLKLLQPLTHPRVATKTRVRI